MKDLQKEKLFSAKPQDAFPSQVEEVKAEVPAFNPLLENVLIEVEEKVSCNVNRDGEVSKFEVKGIIYITVNDPKKNNPAAQLSFTSVKGFSLMGEMQSSPLVTRTENQKRISKKHNTTQNQ